MLSRRQFFKLSGAAGVGLALGSKLGPWVPRAFAQFGGGTLDPTSITKYTLDLVKPPAMRSLGRSKVRGGKNRDYYEIAMWEFDQQILPGKPATTVWSYGPANDLRSVAQGGEFFYPAFTLETTWNKPVQVKWINKLEGKQHLLPVDPSLHWANPIGRRDTRPNPDMDPDYWTNQYIGADGRYTGPVPMVTHVHGAHTTEESDGYAEAWWLPKGSSTGNGLTATTGTFFDYFAAKYGLGLDQGWGDGAATFTYPNNQRATTLWYHDHTLGMTRVNVYAGPAGFYLIRGGPSGSVAGFLPGPAPVVGDDPFGTYYEIPIAIQDRAFNDDGSLFYPEHRSFFEDHRTPDQLQIPFIGDKAGWGYACEGELSDVAKIWQPEYFGNVMVVNGRAWPRLQVEQRRYRFRLLNGCNSRFLILDFGLLTGVEVWQIGAEGGFLPEPVLLNLHPYPGSGNGAVTILMAPAERADIIVDFTNVPVGQYELLNKGPDEPFGGGTIGTDFQAADPATTGQVMLFDVVAATGPDPSTPPGQLKLPPIKDVGQVDFTRQVSLNEEESQTVRVVEDASDNIVLACDNPSAEAFGPTAALLGTLNPDGTGNPLLWMNAVTENPNLGAAETWEIHNFTADAHPIHIHLVQFQVLGREPFGGGTSVAGTNAPLPWETGFKDTVIAYPDEITRVKMQFDYAGFYVWHCHIVEHEDNEMMRPYVVGPQDPAAPHPHS